MLFIILFAALGAGLPLQNNNNTATEKVGWTEAPQARGTFDLLLSCLTTLSLCAWTAYHPNVHFARSGWSRWSHRLLWMFIAVFVPEIVLWCACDQWWVARQLKKTVNEMIEKKTKESEEGDAKEECIRCRNSKKGEHSQDRHDRDEEVQERPHRTASLTSSSSSSSSAQSSLKPWTLEQAFFALSGGFALPSSIPSHPPRTLTPLGIILLLKLDILPNVDPNTIADKSKADGIAKALVCIQAAWFFVQCIARAAKKLPVTVLEIHVLAHVLCAFAIYAVWFRKGYDICAPIVIDGEEAESLGALFVLDAGPQPKELEDVVDLDNRCSSSAPSFAPSEIASLHTGRLRHSSTKKYTDAMLKFIDFKPRYRIPQKVIARGSVSETPEMGEHLRRTNCGLQLLRKRHVHIKFDTYTFLRNLKKDNARADGDATGIVQNKVEANTTVHFEKRYTLPARSDLSMEGLDEPTKKTRMTTVQGRQGLGYAILSILYAGLHFFAWSPSHFPTLIEYNLWRASTISMLVPPVFMLICQACIALDTKVEKYTPAPPLTTSPYVHILQRALKRVAHLFLFSASGVFGTIAVISTLVYPVVRIYLLAESFAGLRSVDRRVYKTVEWVEFVPHAG